MGTSMRKSNQRGFSLVEILMVLILVAILAAIGINAFINFRTEAREAALRGNLNVLRKAVTAHIGNLNLRCGTNATTYPRFDSFTANDITVGTSGCAAGEVPAADRPFVQGAIPVSPFGTAPGTILECGTTGGDCLRGANLGCVAAAAFSNNWCYNQATGEIWIDSSASDAAGTRYDAY